MHGGFGFDDPGKEMVAVATFFEQTEITSMVWHSFVKIGLIGHECR